MTAIPDGFALVPIEPTEAMRVAGAVAWPDEDDSPPVTALYAAMIAAAPKPVTDAMSAERSALPSPSIYPISMDDEMRRRINPWSRTEVEP